VIHDPLLAARGRDVRFSLSVTVEAGVLPRVLQILARRDITPARVLARQSGGLLHIDLVLRDASPEDCHLVHGNLRQVVGVHSLAREDVLIASAAREHPWSRNIARNMQSPVAGEVPCLPN
jgi:acetolactate synthase small subunit